MEAATSNAVLARLAAAQTALSADRNPGPTAVAASDHPNLVPAGAGPSRQGELVPLDHAFVAEPLAGGKDSGQAVDGSTPEAGTLPPVFPMIPSDAILDAAAPLPTRPEEPVSPSRAEPDRANNRADSAEPPLQAGSGWTPLAQAWLAVVGLAMPSGLRKARESRQHESATRRPWKAMEE
jgi:hypothetical protein